MKVNFKIWFIVLSLAWLNESSFAQSQSNVFISGKLVNQNNEIVDLTNNSFSIIPKETIVNTTTNDSSYFCLNFNIPQPQVLKLWNNPFYITPGDSVFANYTGHRFNPEKIVFTGRNAEHYNYSVKYYGLKRSLPFKYYGYDFKNGLVNYLDSLNINKNILVNYLNDFSNEHRISSDFKAYAISQIIYDYYDQMLNPIVNKKYPIEQIPISYSSILDQIKLTDNSLVDKLEYAITAIDLLKYKKLKFNGNDLQLINDNSTGLTKDFLLTCYAKSLISSYTSRDSLVTKELFEKVYAGITNPKFREYFNPLKDQLNKCLNPFPKEVMPTILMDRVGHELTFKDLLAESQNKIIVLDFWASWCGPCKEGMPKVNQVKKNLNNADVEFIFISLDKTETDWRGGLSKTKIPGNHYWIKDNFNSALAKYLIVRSIPRYVIINKAGKIEKIDAFGPYPGDSGLENQLNKFLTH